MKKPQRNFKILIFIVAYNAQDHLEKVLKRIPKSVYDLDYEILIIDDSSTDSTFKIGKKYQSDNSSLNLTVLYNPVNQRYGGNQKLGYQYAINNKFDIVVLLHGDGQYAPELIEKMISRDGIGDLLADGVKVASEKIGRGSSEYAIHAGGQELPMHDPRYDPGYALHYSAEPTPGRKAESLDRVPAPNSACQIQRQLRHKNHFARAIVRTGVASDLSRILTLRRCPGCLKNPVSGFLLFVVAM